MTEKKDRKQKNKGVNIHVRKRGEERKNDRMKGREKKRVSMLLLSFQMEGKTWIEMMEGMKEESMKGGERKERVRKSEERNERSREG